MSPDVKEYAVYRGDEFLFIGTREEIMERMGLTYHSFHHYKSPSHFKRAETFKNSSTTIFIIEIEDDEEVIINGKTS